MALSPQQKKKKEAHERGLRAKTEREAHEERNKPRAASDTAYERFRRIGLSHEEALATIERRKIAAERYEKEQGTLRPLDERAEGILIGPRGGRYRINSKGRKSYDVL